MKLTGMLPLLVCSLYRPPSAGSMYYEALLDNITMVQSKDKEITILGDLNYDYKIDETLNTNPIFTLKTFELKQLITDSTRVTVTSSSTIDLILTRYRRSSP